MDSKVGGKREEGGLLCSGVMARREREDKEF